MGQSTHQREAHPVLVEAGFAYMRTTGDAHNIYRDKHGHRITVASSPTSRSGAMETIKNLIRKAQREDSDVSATSSTAPLIAEADSFLLKKQTSRHGVQARNAALTKWIRRVVEKHGPMDQKILMQACEEMGFGLSVTKWARVHAGVVPYVIPGEGAGKGKGQFTTFIGLDFQVPEGATRLGRKPKAAVADERPEPEPVNLLDRNGAPPKPMDRLPVEVVESIHGANNGESPDPREDPRPHYDPALHDPEPELVPEAAPERVWPAEVPFAPEPQPAEVTAAAQMLLESLGLKTAHPRMGEGLDSLDEFLQDLQWRLDKARESVATLKSLLT